jgi:hypothetical protein
MSSPSKASPNNSTNLEPNSEAIDFIEQVHVNPKKLATKLNPQYDFIVCGSGSSSSQRAVARGGWKRRCTQRHGGESMAAESC